MASNFQENSDINSLALSSPINGSNKLYISSCVNVFIHELYITCFCALSFSKILKKKSQFNNPVIINNLLIIIKSLNVNKLEINYDNFKSIADIENDLTPCVVKDMQYKEKYTKEDLYWLGPDFQDLIIKPLLSFIIWINSCEGEYPDELLNELQTYKDVIKDIFINLDKGLKC